MAKRISQPGKLFMAPAEINTIATDLFGDTWRGSLPEFFGMSYSQLHRYMTIHNGQSVPKMFAIALAALRDLKANDIPFPDMDSFMVEIEKAEPLKYVAEKKDRPVKLDAPAPDFDFGDEVTAEPAKEAPPEPEMVKEEKPAKEPAKRAARKPATAKETKAKAPAKKPDTKKATTAKKPAKGPAKSKAGTSNPAPKSRSRKTPPADQQAAA